jgi:WD40 repeat protein
VRPLSATLVSWTDGSNQVGHPSSGIPVLAVRSASAQPPRPVHAVVFEPSGRYLLAGFVTGQIKVLDAESLQDVHTFEASEGAITMIRVRGGGEATRRCAAAEWR